MFAGRLVALSPEDARQHAERLGAVVDEAVSSTTTVVVIGGGTSDTRRRPLTAPARARVLDEDRFCEMAGLPSPSALKRQFHTARDVLTRYPHLREDHLRYLQKWGLVRPAHQAAGVTYYWFPDLAVLRQADAELARGVSFRAVLRSLASSKAGQLALDFRLDARPAKVLELAPATPPPLALLMGPATPRPTSSAEQLFVEASLMDDGNPENLEEAAAAYRRALDTDPSLAPALVNLANINYAKDAIPEAQALYERAIGLDPDVFEAHFNLGNILHDLGQYVAAQRCYESALALNPSYADTHFYLAVTLEKRGLSQGAQTHWRAYRRLAPDGEWVELAKEFSD